MLTAAGASALVAGSTTSLHTYKGDDMPPVETLPEYIKVEALKGFRAHVDGRFTIVNPGDVVEVTRATAIDLRMANKAIMTDKKAFVQRDYLPERKRPKAPERVAAAK